MYVKLPFFFLSFFLPRIIQILIFYKSIIFQVNKFVYIYIRSYGVVNTNTGEEHVLNERGRGGVGAYYTRSMIYNTAFNDNY